MAPVAGLDQELYPLVWKLQSLGWHMVPSGGGDNGKAPLVPWTRWQHEQPSDAQLHAWQDELRPRLWGILTGRAVVFDADSAEADRPFAEAGLKPHVRTPRGGCHYYFAKPGFPVKTLAGLLPGLDVRAEGGFCNIAGSNGQGAYQIEILPTPDNLYTWDQVPPAILEALEADKVRTSAKSVTESIPQGQRNHTLLSLAGSMRRRGMVLAAIELALLETNRLQCQPPLPDDEVRAIAASVSRYPPNSNKRVHVYNDSDNPDAGAGRTKTGQDIGHSGVEALSETGGSSPNQDMAQRIRRWVEVTNGWFSTDELDRDLGITTSPQKDYRGKVLRRLKELAVLEPHQKVNKQWRYINTRVTRLDFKNATQAGILKLKWPLGIEKYVDMFPGNIAVNAGAPNAGKTAFDLEVVRLNQAAYPVFYFCSEMGSVELRNRLEKFPGMKLEDWTFEAVERASDFADVVRPDCLNIIDFLEMSTELWQVNDHLTAISHKLGTGMALVSIQKKQGAAFGRGQEFGLEKPKLYLSMDKGKITIIKGKSWAQRNVNPHGLCCHFNIIDGCRFEVTKDWDWEHK